MTVKIADFGLAKVEESDLTRTLSAVKGTIVDPGLETFRDYDISYEMHPVAYLLGFIFSGRIDPFRAPDVVLPVIRRCLDPDRTQRYPSVTDLIAEVAAVVAPVSRALSRSLFPFPAVPLAGHVAEPCTHYRAALLRARTPVAQPTAAHAHAGVDKLVVAAADPTDRPVGNQIRQIARPASAAVDGAHGDFAAGNTDSVRGVGIGAGHGDSSERVAPPSPADPLRGGATA